MALVCIAEARAQLAPAEQLIQAGHWKRARVLVEARVLQNPDDALAIFLLSQLRYAFGDHTAPLVLAERAVALDARVAKYHRQLAEVLGVEAQHSGAFRQLLLAHRFRKEIDTAIALDPRDVQALRDLLEFYLLAPGIAGGDHRKAEATARQIAAIDAPEGLLARARIAAFRNQSPLRESLLREALQARPLNYRVPIELARFELSKDPPDLNEAEAVAKDALKLDGTRVDSYAILATVYAIRGAWDALDSLLLLASQRVPDDLVPYYRAAECLLKTGRDPIRAERYLRAYLSEESEGNEPTAAEARRKLATVLADAARSGYALADGAQSYGISNGVAVQ